MKNDNEKANELFSEALQYTEEIIKTSWGRVEMPKKGFGNCKFEDFKKAYSNLSKSERGEIFDLLNIYSSVFKKISEDSLKFKILDINREDAYDDAACCMRRVESISLEDNLEGKTLSFCEGTSRYTYVSKNFKDAKNCYDKAHLNVFFGRKSIECEVKYDPCFRDLDYISLIKDVKGIVEDCLENQRNQVYNRIAGLIKKGLKNKDKKERDSEFNELKKSLVGRLL